MHLRGRGPDTAVLKRALVELIRRHDVLRTCLRSADPLPVRVVHSTVEPKVHEVTLSAGSDAQAVEAGLVRAVEEYGRPFDLTEAPLARFTLVRFGDSCRL